MKRIYLENTLNELSGQIEKLLEKVQEQEVNQIKGYLSISTSKSYIRHYHYYYEDGQINRKYLGKKDIGIVQQLAQKSYNKKVKKCLESDLKIINNLIIRYNPDKLDDIYNNLSSHKRKLVKPIVETKHSFITKWENEDFQTNSFPHTGSVIKTKKGERVRSKSEKILADILYDKCIPYRYEAAVHISNYYIKYPDFTILNPNTLQVVYIEHFGGMDVAQYARDTVNKIQTYAESGILLGVNFFATFETKDEITNYESFSKLIDKIIEAKWLENKYCTCYPKVKRQ